jgi:GTPase SAR1 family protein
MDKYEILSDEYQNHDLSFKVIVIGNSGVGKSCLAIKATKNIFEHNSKTLKKNQILFQNCVY